MRRANDVVFTKVNAAADSDGLLSTADIDASQDFALPVEFSLDTVLQLTNNLHVIQDFELRLSGRERRKLSHGECVRIHRFRHVTNDINSKDPMISRLEPGLPATILFQILKVECGVLRVLLKSTVDRVACITNGDVANQTVKDVVHGCRDTQCEHRKQGFASG